MDGQDRDSLEKVICAITGESIKRDEAVEVSLFFQDGSNQGMFMSKAAVNEVLHQSVPRHPEIISNDYD